MRLTFHLSRFSCQVPSAKVKNGIIPIRTIVGLSQGSCFGLYIEGTLDTLRERRKKFLLDPPGKAGFTACRSSRAADKSMRREEQKPLESHGCKSMGFPNSTAVTYP